MTNPADRMRAAANALDGTDGVLTHIAIHTTDGNAADILAALADELGAPVGQHRGTHATSVDFVSASYGRGVCVFVPNALLDLEPVPAPDPAQRNVMDLIR